LKNISLSISTKTKWIIIVVFTINSFNNYLFSQSNSVLYTFDYEFISGIYKTYYEFKHNAPSINEKALIEKNLVAQTFISNALGDEKIYYYDDSLHRKVRLKKGEFWGYCSNGVVYIYLDNCFHQLLKIGAICYFVETGNLAASNSNIPVTGKKRPFRLVNFKTGEIYDANIYTFQELIKDDQDLYNEFISLKRKSKKKKAMYQFLFRYNEKHPVYFPVVN